MFKTFQKHFLKESAHLFTKSDLNLHHTVLHPSEHLFENKFRFFNKNVPNYPHIKIIFIYCKTQKPKLVTYTESWKKEADVSLICTPRHFSARVWKPHTHTQALISAVRGQCLDTKSQSWCDPYITLHLQNVTSILTPIARCHAAYKAISQKYRGTRWFAFHHFTAVIFLTFPWDTRPRGWCNPRKNSVRCRPASRPGVPHRGNRTCIFLLLLHGQKPVTTTLLVFLNARAWENPHW